MVGHGGWSVPSSPPPRRASRARRFLHTHPTRHAGWNWLIWTVVVLAAIAVSSTRTTSAARPTSSAPITSSAPTDSSPPTVASTPTDSSTPSSARATRPGHAPAPAPAPASEGIVVTSVGAVLPDAARTPGAIDPAVTQATIHRTICVPGWTTTIRPLSSYTTELKIAQLGSGYSYHHDQNPGDYEEDHLISLELGGSPTAATNLWPEPYFASWGARTKDRVENRLHAMVCSGLISLAGAQHAIARNWWVAYNLYVTSALPPVPAPRSSAPAPAPVADPGGGATAQCNDGTYSYAAQHRGACSHHGGVKIFFN